MNTSSIRQALEDVSLEKLGPGFKVLPQKFNVQANDDRSLSSGVNVTWGPMSPGNLIDQCVSVEQDFEIEITARSFVRNDDSKVITTLDSVYDAVGEILKSCIQDRIGIADKAVIVRLSGVSEPRPFNDNQRDLVSIKIGLIISYVIT